MKATFSKDILSFILYFLVLALGIGFVGFPIMTLQKFNNFDLFSVFNAIINLVYILMYLTVVLCLIKIISSTLVSPFIKENVKRFKIMGCCLIVNTIFECIIGYNVAAISKSVTIIGSDSGGITPPMIICLISALMCFVMGEVFDKAIKIKSESDLTI
ncbi:DUF2975 domain-containing protein [Paraclostridium sordellii]|uniref:DUF2975 domain-containing protein n=1 Tax=Paraclostridium sordellii TaxID=1505 RepID=UPI0005E95083|nr:DUF2975 domain-containing protein [Paeniclostridium sordellii]CEQ18111.1 membrane protein [[Clostridium] sordellii] [Paeniclostridium sordellii]